MPSIIEREGNLRRLQSLGIEPLQWRHPPAAANRGEAVLVISTLPRERGMLADLLRTMRIAGRSATIQSDPAADADAVPTIVFDQRPQQVPTDARRTWLQLPSPTLLRGDAAAKRAGWLALRALLRSQPAHD